MKPDQKYMPRNKNDLNFTPLNLNTPFHPSENGWMPVFDLNNGNPKVKVPNESNSIFNPSSTINSFALGSQMQTIPYGTTPNTNLYPNEGEENELFSYNKKRVLKIQNNDVEQINIEDLLTEIDYNYYDFADDGSRCCNDKLSTVFKQIQEENPAIMSTLKSYGMPYPIAKILINKVIHISLENCDGK